MRKGFLLAAASAAGMVLAFPVLAEVTGVGPGEGQVDIVAWAGYIERGETDKNFDWVTDFEAKTGCKVNVKTAATSDEMVALMNEGGFDLVTASGDASLRTCASWWPKPLMMNKSPGTQAQSPGTSISAMCTIEPTRIFDGEGLAWTRSSRSTNR